MKISPKSWKDFQHYKDRNPTWIKLHKKLLDDYEYQCLPLASRALAPMLWLLASECQDGVIDADYAKLAFRLRCTAKEVEEALGPLIGKGFFVVVQFASALLAEPEPDASPEKRREETEKKQASGSGEPASSSPVWRESLTLLQDQGHSEKTARAFLGMLCREYEETEVAAAVLAAAGKMDSMAYVRGVLAKRPKRGELERRKLAL